MAGDIKVGLKIGATMTGGFGQTFGTAQNRLTRLGAAVKALSTQRGLISRFEKDTAALDKTRGKIAEAEKEVARLRKELAASPGNAGLTKSLEAAENKSKALSESLEQQKRKLTGTKSAMTRAGLSTDKLTQDYGRLGKELDRTRNRYDRLDRRMAKKSAATERLGAIKGQVMGMAGAAYAGARIVGEAISFESKMADVGKVVNFAEGRDIGLKKMGAAIKEMSLEIPVAAGGLAEIAAAGGQLGVAEKDIPDFTRTAAKMAIAFDMAAGEAGDAMAKMSNIYGIPISEISLLGDAINHLSDNTAARARELVPVLARVGGTAKQFGLSAVQVAALGDSFIALGKAPETASTAINAMLTKLQTADKQGAKFQKALGEIGLSGKGLKNAIAKDAQGSLQGFLEVLSKVDKQKRTGILVDLFGAEYADDIALLTGSLDTYKKALSKVNVESDYRNSMEKEFINRSGTTANQIQLLKSSVNVLAINLGSALLPAVNSLIEPVMTFSNWAGRTAEKFPWIGKLVGALGAGIGIFSGVMMGATAVTWAWNAALAANPVVWIVGGIIAAVAVIVVFRKEIAGFLTDLFDLELTGKVFGMIWKDNAAVFSNLWAGIKSGVAEVGDILGLMMFDAYTAVTNVWKPIGNFFKNLWSNIVEAFKADVGKMMKLIEKPLALLGSVKGKIGAAKKRTGQILTDTSDTHLMGETFKLMKEDAKSKIGSMFSGLFGSDESGDAKASGAKPLPAPARSGMKKEELAALIAQAKGTSINAPITVNAAPGMDEKAVAEAVDRKLREREAAAGARARGALYD